VPLEFIGHAHQTTLRAMFMYGEDAPCYSAPRMLEEALGESLRCEDFKDWSYSIQVTMLNNNTAPMEQGVLDTNAGKQFS
jgi:hypothetical protein